MPTRFAKRTPPLTTAPPLLPLGDLAPSEFESFCADLIRLQPGVQRCARLGVSGDKQDGIDLIADLAGGRRRVIQCRRWRRFTRSDAERTLQEARYPADEHMLLLASVATATPRRVLENAPGWTIWDADDVAREVRCLPPDPARQLVQTHFGREWRRAFLQLDAPSPFVPAETFFGPFVRPGRLFRHDWTLVGRDADLRALQDQAAKPGARLVLMSAGGGLGKSRLLRAFSDRLRRRAAGVTVRFLLERAPLDLDALTDFEGLPLVLVVDDAHARDDLEGLLAFARRRQPDTLVVFAARPHAEERLLALAHRVGFEGGEVHVLSLQRLSGADLSALARQALGPSAAHLAPHLVAATGGSPLALVIGGQLLARGDVHPARLERHEDFRAVVYSRFFDVLQGEVTAHLDPATCRRVLAFVAAASPLTRTDPALLEAGARLCDLTPEEIARALDTLEEHGVLLRRGRLVKITPDVLSDHLLAEACWQAGRPTGFARRAFDALAPLVPDTIIRNLAELDWRIGESVGESTDLLADVWVQIRADLSSRLPWGRYQLLQALRPAAAVQPERILELVELTLTLHPELLADGSEVGLSVALRSAIASMLRDVALHRTYVPHVIPLLWRLGCGDGRALNVHPDHPVRVLQDLIGLSAQKPLAFNAAVLDAFAPIFAEPGTHNHAHSPLDVTDRLLETGVREHEAAAGYFHVRTFFVVPDAAAPLRERVLDLATRAAESAPDRTRLRVLASVKRALGGAQMAYGGKVSSDVREAWERQQVRALDRLAHLTRRASPIEHVRLRELLTHTRRFAKQATVRDRANALLEELHEDEDVHLVRALLRSYAVREYPPPGEQGRESWKERSQRATRQRTEVAKALLARHGSVEDMVVALEHVVTNLTRAGEDPEPSALLEQLARLDPRGGLAWLDVLFSRPDSVLNPGLGSLLGASWAEGNARTSTAAIRFARQGTAVQAAGVAHAYAWYTQDKAWSAGDFKALEALVTHPAASVRFQAVDALRALARTRAGDALALAWSLPIGRDANLGAHFASLFDDEHGVPFHTLSEADHHALLERLTVLPSWEDHVVQSALAATAWVVPQALVTSLFNRADLANGGEVDAVPFGGLCEALTPLAGHPELGRWLRTARDATLAGGWATRRSRAEVYAELAALDPDLGVNTIAEWLSDLNEERLEALEAVLEHMPEDLALAFPGFVAQALEAAQLLGEAALGRMSSALHHAALFGERHGPYGEPFPQDIDLQRRAAAAREAARPGSLAWRFYDDLARRARHNIERSHEEVAEAELRGE
ncbi:restriction endonuclease [Deinococcus aestuarii]|uniref:restriction endonuclease n=1 Tax=Deinococcus aestuarii TaxID=2774531 RepID=UPI001C0BCAF7|nr:restriction endonuclease [Deinococcus aestuarii]